MCSAIAHGGVGAEAGAGRGGGDKGVGRLGVGRKTWQAADGKVESIVDDFLVCTGVVVESHLAGQEAVGAGLKVRVADGAKDEVLGVGAQIVIDGHGKGDADDDVGIHQGDARVPRAQGAAGFDRLVRLGVAIVVVGGRDGAGVGGVGRNGIAVAGADAAGVLGKPVEVIFPVDRQLVDRPLGVLVSQKDPAPAVIIVQRDGEMLGQRAARVGDDGLHDKDLGDVTAGPGRVVVVEGRVGRAEDGHLQGGIRGLLQECYP